MTKTIAAVTIGQSPRDDIVPEMRALVPDAAWVEAGALDGLDEAGVARLGPVPGEFPLVTRTRAGTAVVGERAILPRLQAAVRRVEAAADLVLVLCTDPLAIESRRPLLLPYGLLTSAVSALRTDRAIVVLTPHEQQVAAQERRWAERGARASIVFASPYAATDFADVGRRARALDASLVVLDCLGYTAAMRHAVAEASGLPTMLARSLLARVAAELVA